MKSKKITNAPINHVYDAISSGETQQIGHDILAPEGQMIIVVAPNLKKIEGKTVIHVLALLALPQNREILEELYTKLTELVAEGLVKPNRHQVLSGGLGGIVQGLQQLQNDQVSGLKLVGRPWESDV